MDDNKIKDLFNGFEPELPSSALFMSKLQKNIEAVEFVRQYNAALRKCNNLAMVIAGACGFVMGVILTLLYPLIIDWITSFNITLSFQKDSTTTIDFTILVWVLVAGVSALTAWNAYEIASTQLTPTFKPEQNGELN